MNVYDIGGEIVELELGRWIQNGRSDVFASCRSQFGRNFGEVRWPNNAIRLFATAEEARRAALLWVHEILDAETRPFPLGSAVHHRPTGELGELLRNTSTRMKEGVVVVNFSDGPREVMASELIVA